MPQKKRNAAMTATPKNVKAPQDYKAEASGPKDDGESMTVKLRGRDWTISKDALDDFELLDDLNRLDQHGDATRMPGLLRRLVGDDQYRVAMDLCRDDKTNRVTLEAGSQFVMDLITELNPNS